jgi:hypothetical protein
MNKREVVQLHVQLDTRNSQMGASNLLRTLDPIVERLKKLLGE